MKKTAFTLIELLVLIAILGVLVALLLSAIQKVRASANRIRCQNNLRQLALAVHNYENIYQSFPAGISSEASQASVQLTILPYLEQSCRFELFDQKKIATDPANYVARTSGDIPVYLCPADPSDAFFIDISSASATPKPVGRCNYYGNSGSHAWWRDTAIGIFKPEELRGIFSWGSRTRINDIQDGMSYTILFAEIKRGMAPKASRIDVSKISILKWNTPNTTIITNPNNVSPLPVDFISICNSNTSSEGLAGLRYYDGSVGFALYNHTLPPNYSGRDCVNSPNRDQFHVASRSHHVGGVNACLGDGSVRFIRDSISFNTWNAMGTRSGGEFIVVE